MLPGREREGAFLNELLNRVRAGRRRAVEVVEGKRRGLRIEIHPDEQGLFELAANDGGLRNR